MISNYTRRLMSSVGTKANCETGWLSQPVNKAIWNSLTTDEKIDLALSGSTMCSNIGDGDVELVYHMALGYKELSQHGFTSEAVYYFRKASVMSPRYKYICQKEIDILCERVKHVSDSNQL